MFLEWDPEDRAKALAYRLEKATKCPKCGTAEWEWDPQGGGSKFAYEAVAIHCRGCFMQETSTEDLDRQPGVTVQLHPTGTVESARRTMAARRRAGEGRQRAKQR